MIQWTSHGLSAKGCKAKSRKTSDSRPTTYAFEIKRWVLSFGPEMEALEPEELRRAVLDDLMRGRALYRSPKAMEPSMDARGDG